MAVSAPSVNDEFDSIDPDFDLVNITTSVANHGTGIESTTAGNYAVAGMTPFYKTGGLLGDKVVYYTPRFNGFQIGASYQPSQDRTGDGSRSATSGFASDTTTHNQIDRAEFAGAYDGKFAGFGVKVGGGYSMANAGPTSATLGTTGDQDQNDEKAWTAGAQLSYMNWTLGGGYLWDNNGQAFKSAGLSANGQTKTWNGGLGYAIGPYHAGLSYYDTQVAVLRSTALVPTAATTYKSNDKLDRWVLGGGYGVAPGVDLNSTLQFQKYNTADSAFNPGGNNNATVFTVGTTVNF
jgi:predicted porin